MSYGVQNKKTGVIIVKRSSSIKTLVKFMIPETQRVKLRRYINKIRFFGFRYKCPICGSNLRKLNPYGLRFPVLSEKNVIGGGYRLNAECPVCYSTDRERLLYLYLLNKTNFFSEKAKILHVAPESGLTCILSSINKRNFDIDYLTADINGDNVMVRMDITEINYPADTFDVIICNHVLEHVVDDEKAMSELYRILKPGGWGVLQVPISLSLDKTFEDFSITDPVEREANFGQSDHVRIYAMDYLDRLKKSGFEVNIFNWQEDLNFSDSKNKYGLLQSESVFVVHKPESVG